MTAPTRRRLLTGAALAPLAAALPLAALPAAPDAGLLALCAASMAGEAEFSALVKGVRHRTGRTARFVARTRNAATISEWPR